MIIDTLQDFNTTQEQKNEILNKIQDALRRSFERKQEQIKANLEQITAIEKELQEAK